MIKVLGIGSPFADDRVGFEVLQQLKKIKQLKPFIPTQLCLEQYDRPGINLLNLLQGCAGVFIVDAIKTKATPGTIHRFQDHQIESLYVNTLSSHSIGVVEALALGRELKLLPDSVIIYGVEINNIDYSFESSTIIKDAILSLSKMLSEELLLRVNC
jgi:hydrogenase maturation protease